MRGEKRPAYNRMNEQKIVKKGGHRAVRKGKESEDRGWVRTGDKVKEEERAGQ